MISSVFVEFSVLLEELILFAFLASSDKMASNPYKAYDSFQSLPSIATI